MKKILDVKILDRIKVEVYVSATETLHILAIDRFGNKDKHAFPKVLPYNNKFMMAWRLEKILVRAMSDDEEEKKDKSYKKIRMFIDKYKAEDFYIGKEE